MKTRQLIVPTLKNETEKMANLNTKKVAKESGWWRGLNSVHWFSLSWSQCLCLLELVYQNDEREET